MKASNLLTLLIALLCCLPATAEKKPHYKLVWQDHFRSSRIDTTSWEKIPRGQSDWDRHMSSVDSLYAIRNGCLVLRGVVNRTETSDTARYITGGLYTRGKRHISYGKVEVRARLGRAQGAWPAIWMLPFTAQWPMGGEIDIMEHLNHDSIAYQTIHTHYTYNLHFENEPPHGSTHPIDRDGFNTYAVEILPDSLVFSINGDRYFTYPRIETDKPGQYPFGTPFYLLIDMQIEGSWVGRAKPEELPVEMEIDWVKMYELKK